MKLSFKSVIFGPVNKMYMMTIYFDQALSPILLCFFFTYISCRLFFSNDNNETKCSRLSNQRLMKTEENDNLHLCFIGENKNKKIGLSGLRPRTLFRRLLFNGEKTRKVKKKNNNKTSETISRAISHWYYH